MTTLAHLPKTALSFPKTAEQGLRSGTIAFTTGKKRFASAKDYCVELHLPTEDADRMLAAHPTAKRLTGGGVRVPLSNINGQHLNHWLRCAWRSRAPKRLAEQAVAADTAAAGEVGDLPKAIGRPATQALISVGITTLEQVAELTEAELRAMHGIGSKAVRVLREALGATGRQLKA